MREENDFMSLLILFFIYELLKNLMLDLLSTWEKGLHIQEQKRNSKQNRVFSIAPSWCEVSN